MKIQSAHRRRRSRAPLVLAIALLALIGLLWWLASRDTQVPLAPIEIDVTNAAAAK